MPRDNPEREPPRTLPTVIVDVDGTLCDVREIRHFVELTGNSSRKKRDFDSFHSASRNSPPYSKVVDLVISAKEAGFHLTVVTAREEKWRALTEEWLNSVSVPFDRLVMRPESDFRPDHVVKRDLLENILQSHIPVLAIDDRLDIIEVWRARGITCLHIGLDGSVESIIEGKTTVLNEGQQSQSVLSLIGIISEI